MDEVVANHHAHHPGFAGASGTLIGLTMALRGGRMARLAADLVNVGPNDRVVDVGCGPGTAARIAARRGARVTGVDPAAVMLRLARTLTVRDEVTWVDGTAESLPLDDASATVLWSLVTVHHWHDVDQGLAEAHRVLAPSGRLLAAERRSSPDATGHASHGWTDERAAAFAERCGSAGFTDVNVSSQALGRRGALIVQATRP
jgi:ubiquinone/menaquinone biosynthesis C-methylase UbiE